MSLYESLRGILGLGFEPKNLGPLQVCLRAIIVFVATLVIVRLADKRFLSKMSAFDAVVGFILASALARAVNGSAPFFSTLLAGFLLVLLHRLLGIVAYHWHWFGKLVKGEAQVLVRGGKLNRKTLRDHKISDADLLEESRLNGQVNELDQIQTATFERNGKISVIPAKEKSG